LQKMLHISLLACILAVAVTGEELWDTSAAHIVQLVNGGDYGWTAELSPRFQGRTIDQVKDILGCGSVNFTEAFSDIPKAKDPDTSVAATLPKTFDGRIEWPAGCVHAIRDQGNCGSCWAFSISESLSDRGCVATGGGTNVVLSPQHLVTCANNAWAGKNGCAGGYLVQGWAFTQSPGLVTEGCIPYTSGGGQVPACAYTGCADGSPVAFYTSVKGSTQQLSSVAAIQSGIANNGPVSACFTVYQDFTTYKSGVYHHTSGSSLGGHCVKIIGWGSNYWVVANSWGTSWGMSGFFWIQMGTNECGIESAVIVAQA